MIELQQQPQPLSSEEVGQLKHYEGIVERNMRGILEGGAALGEIRDRVLWRESYGSFGAYLAERWPQISRQHRHRLVTHGSILEDIEELSPMGDKLAPPSERALRPLGPLSKAERLEVYETAQGLAPPGETPSGRLIEKVLADKVEAKMGEDPLSAEGQRQGALDFMSDFREKKAARQNAPQLELSSAVPISPTKKPSGHNEWYTPARYIDAARRVLGGIDLDPASCDAANITVNARQIWDIETNGLDKPWPGRVWLNPPYGRDENGGSGALRWVTRLVEQYADGVTTAAIVCVNSLTYAPWFQPLYDFPICFTDHRVTFECGVPREDDRDRPSNGTAFIYLGRDVAAFIEEFSQFGRVMTQLHPTGREV